MKISQSFSLDFGRQTIPVTVFAKQRDKESRSLEITPLICGQRLELGDNITARLELTKPDGYSVVNDQSIKNGIIIVELTEQILAAAGTATAEIGLYKDGMRVSSQVFYINIQESACDGDKIESSNEFKSFDNIIEKANKAAEDVETLVDDIKQKLENGELKGEKGERGEQGVQGERGEKGEDGKDGKTYELTDDDKHEIADLAVENASEAAKKANKAAEDAQTLVDDIKQKLESGEFKGEKGERGEQGLQGVQGVQGERGEKGAQGEKGADGVSPTVSIEVIDGGNRITFTDTEGKKSFDVLNGEVGGGGTVTYKIPLEECVIDTSNSDSSTQGIASILIPFGTIIANTMQLEADLETGVIEIPEAFYTWELAEQEKFMLDIYMPYISDFNIKPWAPEPRKPWLELLIDFTALNIRIFEQSMDIASFLGIEGNGIGTMYLNKIFNNDFKVSVFAENQDGEVAYSGIKSDMALLMNATISGEYPFMLPFFGFMSEEDETGIATITLGLLAVGTLTGYRSLLTGFSSYIVKDDIKELEITFIPNNTVLEVHDNEQSV